MDPKYPIFVFEKDDRSLRMIESLKSIRYHLEAIDIENDEYVFWDRDGRGVRVITSGRKIADLSSCEATLPWSDGFSQFLSSNELPKSIMKESPMETWEGIQGALSARPKKAGFWSRLFASKWR